jgi:hypothetical protein
MKYPVSISISMLTVMLLLLSCGPSRQELAQDKLNKAEVFLAKGDTITCLAHLDSLARLFPECQSEITKATTISSAIYTSQLIRERQNLESANTLISSYLKDFKPEKGEFERYTNYIPNRQVFDKSWSRSFIQVSLNEKGDLTLASNYYGEQWLNHTSFRIVTELLTVKTDSVPLETINNHRSDFGESKWEKVTYRGDQAEEVIKTIALNADKKVKAVFKGNGSSTYIMWLEDYDKEAIKAAYNLSKGSNPE